MIGKDHPSLSVGAQCRLLSISRSSFYCELTGETVMNLDLMVVIDKQFLETPFYGAQQMTWHLQNEGHVVNYKRIRQLMRLMRVRLENGPPDRFLTLLTADLPEARYQQAGQGPQDLPLSVGGLRVERPNQAWCADITYLPMRRGARHGLGPVAAHATLYLVAVMDWFTRKVLAWRISNMPASLLMIRHYCRRPRL